MVGDFRGSLRLGRELVQDGTHALIISSRSCASTNMWGSLMAVHVPQQALPLWQSRVD